ncbi:helix-turn-helix domain-containing protein [Bhargavaea ginsengi]|uniref:helix-turn-helix domain-containing protein n=1 Tax=Bhargavaea ginsengi TaxID=426757 RepID=UPI003C722F1B
MYKNLLSEIKNKGFTQAEVAKAAGMAESSLSQCLSGRMRFKLDQAIAIRDELFPGMNLDYLFMTEKREEAVR